MKILTKLFDFLLNPSKRVKHMLKPKKRNDDLGYALGKKIKSLQTKNEIGTATTYQSVFIKFFIITTIAFLMAFIIYYKLDSIESIFKFIKKYNLPDYESKHSEDYQRTLVTDYLLLALLISAILAGSSWAIGFYLYNPFLKFATFILSFFSGVFLVFLFHYLDC
ncbi:hypothetical protein PSOLA_01090 [Candidatus Phytoplasma solani]